MGNMKTNLIPILALATLGAAAVYHLSTKEPRANAVVPFDGSLSVMRNCNGLAEETLSWLDGKPGIGEGSRLTMLIMGIDAANPEPKSAFTRDIPVEDDTVLGGNPEAFRAAQDALRHDIQSACEGARAGSRSPVYQLLKQALAVVRPQGKGHGYVLLKSDLDDDAHPVLRRVLNEAIRNPDAAVPPELIASLENANTEILICGTAELAPRRTASTTSFETRLRIWREMLTHPELLHTKPYCGAESQP